MANPLEDQFGNQNFLLRIGSDNPLVELAFNLNFEELWRCRKLNEIQNGQNDQPIFSK